jgi:ElaB/YqjD/DUF883 family membrane-anchored ribosome-binding protein
MQADDLTKVKYIGASRMKSLKDSGITTIKQLYEAPTDELARLPNIGKYYAKLIKSAVNNLYKEKPGELTSKTIAPEGKVAPDIKENLSNQIKTLRERLKQTGDALESREKKRHPKLYMGFKKRSGRLMKRLEELNKVQGDLSGEISKNIIKKADTLNALLKKAGKGFKKKKYEKLSQRIQSLSKFLKKNGF